MNHGNQEDRRSRQKKYISDPRISQRYQNKAHRQSKKIQKTGRENRPTPKPAAGRALLRNSTAALMQQEQETQHARRQAVEAMQERDQALSLAEQAFVERDDALALRDAALATAQQLTKERSLGQHFEFSFCVNSSKKKRDVYEVAELLVKAAVAAKCRSTLGSKSWHHRHVHVLRGICTCRIEAYAYSRVEW